MKIFWAVLALIVLAAGVYFWLGTNGANNLSDNASSTYAEFLKKLSVLNNIKQKGSDIFNNAGELISSTARKIIGVKNFLEAAPKTVSSTISDLYDQIKSQLPPAALKLISGETGKELQNFISPSGQFFVSTSSVASLANSVCVEFNNGSSVDYSIQNPFSPPKDYVYHIDWGDGASSGGNVLSADTPLPATHHYSHSGDYQNSFSITAASTTLKAQVRVCIN